MSPTKPAYTTWQNNTNATWYKDAGLRKSMISIFVLYFCVFTLGYDGSLLNGLQTLEQWQIYFDHPSGGTLGLISMVMYFPNLVVPLLASWISEKYGRRPPVFIGSIICIIGTFVVTFSNSRGMFMGGRAILGAGISMQGVTAPALLLELAHPRLRSIAGASYLTVYYVGSTTSAWICYGTQSMDSNWAWRIPCLIMCTGVVIVLVYVSLGLMPESPRWMIKNGQHEKALRLLAAMHANGDEQDELVVRSIAEIEASLELDRQAKHTGYSAFLKTPGNRRRLLVIFMLATGTQLNGVGLVSYYLAPILSLVGITERGQQAGLNGGLAIFNLVCSVVAAQVVDRWGRRPLWLLGNSGQLVCFILITALSGAFANNAIPALGISVIPFLYLYYGFYDICWTVLPNLYIPEITPYHLRTKALSIYAIIQAVSITFNQYVNPVALEKIAWKYYIVYVVVILAYLIYAYFCLVETKGYTIEEVSRLFDGEDAAADVEHQATEIVGLDQLDDKAQVSHVEDSHVLSGAHTGRRD
ncbi:hypothetical protein IAR55_001806 [Kwoniella newhampshirensis]|uniref:Major facilitator superfamily (MFS) profile domain-containing protein n=1 Tax=Kwoniella newhampshirensis TaxID=1651941 RepID=A0AAW0Z386_9TREE